MDQTVEPSQVCGVIKAPASKSYAQRAIAAGLLSNGTVTLCEVELCSDTAAALGVAEALGAKVTRIDDTTYTIRGGVAPQSNAIDIGESGLATRMFTPIAALHNANITITGHGSIMTRPMNMMFQTLHNLGVQIFSEGDTLPITVCGPMRGGESEVNGTVSSQFLTGLLMATPLAKEDTTLYVEKLNSIPYIDMTLDVLRSFGVEIKHHEHCEFFIEGNQSYNADQYTIEGDWSGASCMLVAGAIAGEVTVKNLNPLSIQADAAIIEALSRAGAQIITTTNSVTVTKNELRPFEFDATHCPDLFPALAALAALCNGESVITGTSRLTHKESNRAKTIAAEFAKMGIDVDITEHDTMRILGGKPMSAKVKSHNDHRIAMAAAVMGLCADGAVQIAGADAVNKSYPNFWHDLESIKKNSSR